MKEYNLCIIYDPETGAFELTSPDALKNMETMMSLLDLELKPTVTSAQLAQRMQEYTKKYNTDLDTYQAITMSDFNKKYNLDFEPDEILEFFTMKMEQKLGGRTR